MLKLIRAEWLKLRKSTIFLPMLAAPILSIGLGYLTLTHGKPSHENSLNPWTTMYFNMAAIYAIFLLPLLTGILATFVCRYEHLSGGWKQLSAMPVSKSSLYLTKLIFTLFLIAVVQLLFFLGVFLVGSTAHLSGSIPWFTLFRSLAGGWLAIIPLAALQLWVATAWNSFGTPFALNVVLTIPAMAVARSNTYGSIYPWTQPMLAMLPSNHGLIIVTQQMALTIFCSGIMTILCGWLYYVKRNILS